MSALLGNDLVAELDALARRMQIRARSGGLGERGAPRRGASAEFLEHRPYEPGDDLRRVDWAVMARTGEPALKLFRAEEDVAVRLVVDASASLDFGEPTKIDAARRIAASIGYLALARGERAQVVAASEAGLSRGEVSRGRAGLPRLLRDLSGIRARGSFALAGSVDAAVRRFTRPGALVVLSDFLDPSPLEAALGRARAAGHDVALVQVLADEELKPDLEGDYALEDAETGARLELTIDGAALDAYAARLEALFDSLRALARKLSGSYVRTCSSAPPLAAVQRFVRRSID